MAAQVQRDRIKTTLDGYRDMKVVSTLHDLTQKVGANNKAFPSLPVFKQASGSRLYADSGKVFIDLAFTSLANLLGHNIANIHQAICNVPGNIPPLNTRLDSHPLIEKIYQQLHKLLPKNHHVSFFCNHEAQAMDTALKLAYLYWEKQANPDKNKFIAFAHSHHGYSLGVSSLNASNIDYQNLAPLAPECELIPYPNTWLGDANIEHKEQLAYQRLAQYLEENHHNCCALVLEPLVQSRNGLQICRPSFIESVCMLVQSYDILVIADERFTGLYRCGKFLATELLNISVNITVLGSTLSNNTLPCGMVITDSKIRQTLHEKLQNNDFKRIHGHQTNPLTAAAITASLDILQQTETQKHLNEIYQLHESKLHWLMRKPIVRNIRFIGVMGAFDIICERHNQQQALQYWFQQACMDNQLLLASHKSSIYILPPYCMSLSDLEDTYEKIDKILASLPLHYITPCSSEE